LCFVVVFALHADFLFLLLSLKKATRGDKEALVLEVEDDALLLKLYVFYFNLFILSLCLHFVIIELMEHK